MPITNIDRCKARLHWLLEHPVASRRPELEIFVNRFTTELSAMLEIYDRQDLTPYGAGRLDTLSSGSIDLVTLVAVTLGLTYPPEL